MKRRRNFRRTLFLLVAAAGVVLGLDSQRSLQAPLNLHEKAYLEVVRGMAFGTLLNDIESKGWLAGSRQRLYLYAYARLTRQDAAIRAGEYELQPGMTGPDLLALLVSGKVVLHELRLVEGWRFEQALEAVAAEAALQHTLQVLTPETVMKALGQPDLHPEGRLYPDTYHFPRGTTDVDFLKRASSTLDQVLAAEWQTRAADLPYRSPYEALIMASIVERETGQPEEREEIAGVFVRRLQRGMRLQTDPTVIYGLGAAFDGNLHKRDLLTDTPYNTYTRAGLPPTPICLPGRASIHAALHPAGGGSLYFVSRGDGSHYFSATLAEHAAAVRKYQLRRK